VRTIFIGDVHGCLDELRALVRKLGVTDEDRVICIGDLINKGPDSAGVVRYVYSAGFECVRGNHDQSYCDAPGRPGNRKVRKGISDDVHEWFVNLPLYIKEKRFLAVHAGLPPEGKVCDVPADVLMNIRTWSEDGCLNRASDPPWYALYRGKRKIVYGHWAAQGLMLRKRTIGLDSGCAYGKQLSAYVLETGEIVQVNAGRAYESIK
jgi:serine/threonine protein phosphatase 1